MSQQASPGDSGSTARRTSLWQLALVAVALGAFSFFVLLPTGLLAVLFVSVVRVARSARLLERLGVLVPGIFEGAMTLAMVLVCLGLALVSLVMGWRLMRRLAGEQRKPPLMLRWPWLSFGVLLLLALALLVPSGGQSSLPVLSGGLVLASDTWLVLTAASAFVSLCLGGLSLSWRLARVSPFGAGLLTLGGLGSAFFVLTVFGLVTQAIEAQASSLPAPRTIPACSRLTAECTRQLLLSSTGRTALAASSGLSPSVTASASAPAWAPRGTSSAQGGALDAVASAELESVRSRRVRACLDTHYQNRTMLAEAHDLAERLVGTGDAWDIVHATLLNVCLRASDAYDFRQFFLRSIRNGSYHWLRSGFMRSCSLDDEDAPEPECATLRPDEDYLRSETLQALRVSLCSLDAGDREVLFLRYFEELSELEIADRQQVSYAAARKRLQRAREKLEADFLQRCR